MLCILLLQTINNPYDDDYVNVLYIYHTVIAFSLTSLAMPCQCHYKRKYFLSKVVHVTISNLLLALLKSNLLTYLSQLRNWSFCSRSSQLSKTCDLLVGCRMFCSPIGCFSIEMIFSEPRRHSLGRPESRRTDGRRHGG